MADEWDEFSDADPWNEFQDAPTSKKARVSQTQGFVEGVSRVAKNVAPLVAALPGGMSVAPLMEAQGRAALEGVKGREAQGVRSGRAGKLAGSIAASTPLAFVGGPMTGGALQGYASSEADGIYGKLGDAALGAIGGKVGERVLRAGANALAPVIEPAVKRLAAGGVKLTPGMIRGGKAMVREDKLASRPIVGDLIAADRQAALASTNVALVNKALSPLGVSIPKGVAAGHDAVAYAQQVVEDAYNAVVPKLAVRVDPRFVAGIKSAYETVTKLPETQQQQFGAILNGIRFGQGGSLAGRQLKDAQSEITRLATTYSQAAAPADRELGRALWSLRGELDDMMLRQNPAHAPDLQKANQAFRGLAIAEDAASRADEGIASTGQIRQAVRRADTSRRKKASAGGRAFMQEFAEDVRRVIPARTPDSGTAGRLMAANPLAYVWGQAAALGYQLGKRGAQNALAASPVVVGVANILRRLSEPAGRVSGAAVANRPRE